MTIALDRRSLLQALAASPLLGAAPTALARQVAIAPAASLTIATTHGFVKGRTGDGIRLFTGIPYGHAARFAAPQPALRWQGVFDATKPANVSPQPRGMVPYSGIQSEDCLQLNVWAPMTPGPHPVLVYIHGGGNETGWSGEDGTAGDRFAAHGVVCVTVNYRVGALGFLDVGELLGATYRGSANNGIRDIVLALHWVRANIAGFGGDPRRVTIAGESAGGKNVGTVMGVPAADRLYAQAAIFSGGGQTVHTMEEARAFARLFAEKIGGTDALRTASIGRLLTAQTEAKAAWPRNFPFRPVIDAAFLPMVPLARIKAGKSPPVPLLIGTNADESRVFLPTDQAARPLASRSVANEPMQRMDALERAYARAFPEMSPAERHWRLLTAEEYGIPCLRIAEGHAARGASVWRYRLTYPAPDGPFKGHTPHVLDIPFTFDHVANAGFGRFFGLGPADQPMAKRMHGAMLRFLGTGRPAVEDLPAWPRYDLKSRATLVLDRESKVIADPDRTERLIWQG